MNNTEKTMEKIVALCKGRGFIFAGSEIYGGLSNTWDYGPLGVELKNNVKRAWWKRFVQQNPYNVGLDSAILMNPEVWVATGHVSGFSDPLMDCKDCKTRHRADVAIALIQKYWGRGIGTAMFEEMIHIAKERGIEQLELEVMEGNDRAIRLYEKFGFERFGVRPNAIHLKDGTRLRELLMVKVL